MLPRCSPSAAISLTAEENLAEIRAFPASSEVWRIWLARFPEAPSWHKRAVDDYIARVGPYLFGQPATKLLAPDERLQLRALFANYGKSLIDDQRRTNWKTLVEVGGIAGSAAGWLFKIALFEPITLTLSVAAFGRNFIVEREWRMRKHQLSDIATWIADLVDGSR